MKAIILDKVGGTFTLVNTLPKPTPSRSQILVKCLVTSLNPIERIQQANGMLVQSWPIVLGCDASGIVVETGEDVTKFKKGDRVYGNTRLGTPGYGTFQEFFLMDEFLTFKTPDNISDEQAATIGSGLLAAYLALVNGIHIDFGQHKSKDPAEWVIIIGAAGSVGQFSVQIVKLCGFKVLAFCASANNELITSLGADGIVDHRTPVEDQLKEVQMITGGNFCRIFDSSAMATETGIAALARVSCYKNAIKYFATTNDWDPIKPCEGINIYQADLGDIGQGGDKRDINQKIAAYIPILQKHLGSGALKPMNYEQVGDIGVEEILKGLIAFNAKKGSAKKTIVRLSEALQI